MILRKCQIVASAFLILLCLQFQSTYCQSNSIMISYNSSEILYCDHSSPAVLSLSFEGATSLHESQIQIIVQKNTSENRFIDYIDAFGDKLYHTTFSPNNNTIISSTTIGSGNQVKGNYSLRVLIMLINSSQLQISSNNPRISISRNEAGDIRAELMITLEISDNYGGERRKTYTYDDLKSMTPGQLIIFFIMVLINNYAWLIVFFIAVWLFGRYRGYRKIAF